MFPSMPGTRFYVCQKLFHHILCRAVSVGVIGVVPKDGIVCHAGIDKPAKNGVHPAVTFARFQCGFLS